jgi:hypothetical protein
MTMKKKIGGLLTSKEIDAIVKNRTITETIRLHRLCWFGHVQKMEENRIPKRLLCMNLEILYFPVDNAHPILFRHSF